MIGCAPPLGYVAAQDGRTLPPRIVFRSWGAEKQWVTSQRVEKGETLWSEHLFIFGVGVGGSDMRLSEDAEWNQMASTIWNAMVSKGGENVKMWAVGFSALVRALLVEGNRPRGGNVLFVERRQTLPQEDAVPVALAALLVKGFQKLRGCSPLAPVPAAWFLMGAQESSIPLRDSVPSSTLRLNGFLTLLQKAAKVPLRAAANAVLLVTISAETQEVEVRCVALKPIPEGTQVRLHIGSSLALSIAMADDSKIAWSAYCEAMEARLLPPLVTCH